MELIRDHLNNSNELDRKEKKIIIKMFEKVLESDDDIGLQEAFDKILEKELKGGD